VISYRRAQARTTLVLSVHMLIPRSARLHSRPLCLARTPGNVEHKIGSGGSLIRAGVNSRAETAERASSAQLDMPRRPGHYNHNCYHESLSNLTPADVDFGRGQTILVRIRL
jgi:hypothetical protein